MAIEIQNCPNRFLIHGGLSISLYVYWGYWKVFNLSDLISWLSWVQAVFTDSPCSKQSSVNSLPHAGFLKWTDPKTMCFSYLNAKFDDFAVPHVTKHMGLSESLMILRSFVQLISLRSSRTSAEGGKTPIFIVVYHQFAYDWNANCLGIPGIPGIPHFQRPHVASPFRCLALVVCISSSHPACGLSRLTLLGPIYGHIQQCLHLAPKVIHERRKPSPGERLVIAKKSKSLDEFVATPWTISQIC